LESDGEFIMAVKYLSGNRLWGTNAERLALTEPSTYSTTFADDSDWTLKGGATHLVIDESASKLEFDLTDDDTDEYIHKDLHDADALDGSNASDTAWVLRYEMTFSTLNANTEDNNNAFIVGLYDNSAPTGLVSTGNALTYNTQVNAGFANVLSAVDGGSQEKDDVSNDPFSISTATSTIFYIEIKRVSADEIEQRVYANSDYSTGQVLNSSSTMEIDHAKVTGATGLRYLTVKLDCSGAIDNGYTGFIQNLKFWNGVTTVYPNLPNGSVFITSDTNVHYMWNGTDTWNEVA